jgi:phage gp36-like protein
VTYATRDDLAKRFGEVRMGELADRDGDNVEDTGVVVTALLDADHTINAYLAGRYRVPLAPVEELVVRLASELAWYFLHGDAPPEDVVAKYKAAIKTLEGIAGGFPKLQAAGLAAEPAAAGDFNAETDAPPSLMRDAMENF